MFCAVANKLQPLALFAYLQLYGPLVDPRYAMKIDFIYHSQKNRNFHTLRRWIPNSTFRFPIFIFFYKFLFFPLFHIKWFLYLDTRLVPGTCHYVLQHCTNRLIWCSSNATVGWSWQLQLLSSQPFDSFLGLFHNKEQTKQ